MVDKAGNVSTGSCTGGETCRSRYTRAICHDFNVESAVPGKTHIRDNNGDGAVDHIPTDCNSGVATDKVSTENILVDLSVVRGSSH